MKYFFSLVLIISVLCIPHLTHALVISEIMYDPEGTDTKREWIEIFNDEINSIDISKVKLKENNVNHGVTVFQGSTILDSGQWAIIADNTEQFLVDYPDYTGQLFDSAFSLSNTGEILELLDAGLNVLDTFIYTGDIGAKNNGQSLQVNSDGIIIYAIPTIGDINKNVSEEIVEGLPSGENISNNTISTHSSQSELSSFVPKIPKIDSGRDRMSTIHSNIDFEAIFEDRKYTNDFKYTWFFGDGFYKKGKRVTYSYKNKGVYNMVLHAKSKDHYLVARNKVFITEPKLYFSATSTSDDNLLSILVQNQSESEVNIGDFIVEGDGKEFVFPKDTILDPNTEILFDSSLFNLPSNIKDIYVFYPNKKLLVKVSNISIYPHNENIPLE